VHQAPGRDPTNADPLRVAEPDIAAITSRMTMVGGKNAWQTPHWPD
jgi:hypothetical protein